MRRFPSPSHRSIDEFISFPGYPGLPEQAPDLPAFSGFVSEMRTRRIDLIIQLHGAGSYVIDVAILCHAWETAGFYTPSQSRPTTGCFIPYPEAGRWAGCRTVLIDNGHETDWHLTEARWPDYVAGSLVEACAPHRLVRSPDSTIGRARRPGRRGALSLNPPYALLLLAHSPRRPPGEDSLSPVRQIGLGTDGARLRNDDN